MLEVHKAGECSKADMFSLTLIDLNGCHGKLFSIIFLSAVEASPRGRYPTRTVRLCKREESSKQKIFMEGILSAKPVMLVAHWFSILIVSFPYIVVGPNWLLLSFQLWRSSSFPVFVRQIFPRPSWHSFHLVYGSAFLEWLHFRPAFQRVCFSPTFSSWAIDFLAQNLTSFSSCSLCLQNPQQSWLAWPTASEIWLFCANRWWLPMVFFFFTFLPCWVSASTSPYAAARFIPWLPGHSIHW